MDNILDSIEYVEATPEFLGIVADYTEYLMDFLDVIIDEYENDPILEPYFTEENLSNIISKHINLVGSIFNISQIEEKLDHELRESIRRNTIPFRKYNQPYDVFDIISTDEFMVNKKSHQAIYGWKFLSFYQYAVGRIYHAYYRLCERSRAYRQNYAIKKSQIGIFLFRMKNNFFKNCRNFFLIMLVKRFTIKNISLNNLCSAFAQILALII